MSPANDLPNDQDKEPVEVQSPEKVGTDSSGNTESGRPSLDKIVIEEPVDSDSSVLPASTESNITDEATNRMARSEQDDQVYASEKETRERPHSISLGPADSSTEASSENDSLNRDQQVEVNAIRADMGNVGGRASREKVEKTTETERLPLHSVDPSEWDKVKAVFVPSQDYEEAKERGFRTYEHRVFIVYGDEHAGKLTCAVHLGWELWGEGQISVPKFNIITRTSRDTRLLVDLVQDQDLPQDTIYIVEDAFENGVDFFEFSSPFLSTTNAALEGKNAYLILTTTYQDEQLAELPVCRISAAVKDMHTVFEKHLVRYSGYAEAVHVPQALIELARENQKELEKRFQRPFQVDVFFRDLGRLSPEANREDLIKIADSLGRIGKESPYLWFTELSNNAKLYAMLVVLFEGIDRHSVNEIYAVAAQLLRGKGVSNLDDPREMGLSELLEEIQAQETEAQQVRFSSPAFEQEVHRQIVNHHHLLWSFIELPLALTEAFSAPHFWEFRRDLGAAIGRLGVYHIHKLYPVLEALARHSSGGVVAVAGYALSELCRTGSGYFTFVTDLLETWVDSGDPDLMWAAGASIWRIYDSLARVARGNEEDQEAEKARKVLSQVRDILTKLAETCDQFGGRARAKALEGALAEAQAEATLSEQQYVGLDVAQYMREQLESWAADNVRSVLHAIRRIALTNSADVVELIAEWLKAEKGSNLRLLGEMAGRQLFDENSDPELQLLEGRHGPLLDLIGALLPTHEETVDTAMRALVVWLQRPGWSTRVHSALLHVVNRAQKEEVGVLRESLSRQWLDSDLADAQHIGRSLIARSYVMDGVPTDMPGQRYGIIMLDASHKARLNKACAQLGRRLYERLDPQIDIHVLRMGEKRELVGPGQIFSSGTVQSDYDKPCILMPTLEEFDPRSAHTALALSWGPIVDLGDACAGPWRDRLVIVAVQQQGEYPDGLTVIPVKSLVTTNDLIAIENAVRGRLARALATLGSDEWWAALSTHFQTDAEDVAVVVARLNECVDQLDDIKYCEHPADIARVITCAVLWLAAKDLPRCVEFVHGWLTSENELSRLMGLSCTKTLFHVYAHSDPIPPVESHAVLLELVLALANYGWGGLEAVLYAAQKWGTQASWSERMVACPDGRPGELLQLINDASPEVRKRLENELEKWLTSGDAESIAEPLAIMVEQLQLYLALGGRKSPPELPEGHTYGLIVVDTSDRENQVRTRLADLANGVIGRLNERGKESLHILIYRLGQDYPLAGPGQKKVDFESLGTPGTSCRPRLLSPLLEVYSPKQVSFVLLLVSGVVLDQDDWIDTHWSEIVYVYSDSGKYHPRLIASIPRQPILEDAEKIILQYLERR